MARRHLRGDSLNDGKIGYLENLYEAWRSYLAEMWQCMTTAGMREVSVGAVGGAARLLQVTEEVVAFVRDMDLHGVGFLTDEWDEEARL